MKGKCDLIICQVCNQEMSFGRIKSHIKARHKEITVEEYVNKFWQTLPLHNLCKVCNNNVVYKYDTCSKECRHIQHSSNTKDIPKPEGFMSKEHIQKISNSHFGKIVSKETGGKISKSSQGISRNKGKQPMLGKKQSDYQKQRVSETLNDFYASGGEPWTKNNKHTPETIEKIFKHRKINKLEKFVSDILDENKIEYKFQFFIKTKDGICKSYDFKIKDTNILIEIDGDYWHGNPNTKYHFYKLNEVKINDQLKDQIALDSGYLLLRFWESEVYENPEIIINKIKECHHSKD